MSTRTIRLFAGPLHGQWRIVPDQTASILIPDTSHQDQLTIPLVTHHHYRISLSKPIAIYEGTRVETPISHQDPIVLAEAIAGTWATQG